MAKRPKLRKYPKKPKANASLRTLENYDKKLKEIDKENKEKLRDYEKALKLEDKIDKKRRDPVRR